MLMLLRKPQLKKWPSLPLGPWHEAVQREALQIGECGPDAPWYLLGISRSMLIKAKLMERLQLVSSEPSLGKFDSPSTRANKNMRPSL